MSQSTSTAATRGVSSAVDPQSRPVSLETNTDEERTPVNAPNIANPFSSPLESPLLSRAGSTTRPQLPNQRRYFHSRRIQKGTVERPWLAKKDPREKWVTIIPLIGIVVGLGITGLLIWDGLRSVVNHEYCPVLLNDFSNGLDPKIWTKEAEVGGFGNGQFEETTTNDENAFVKDSMLYIKPTVRDRSVIENNETFTDLLHSGICSSHMWSDCIIHTNLTNGTIINPVASARLSTKKGATIKYGRVEVEAQLPNGDWIWPAIWMMPVDSKYGPWPRSGEIDIMESRGNNWTYSQGGNNIISSSMHWGPDLENDGWWRNNVKRKALHTTYSHGFHKFGLEWSENYIFTYIDTRLLQVMYTKFDEPLFKKGNFPAIDSNGTRIADSWSFTGRDSTPFDQDFYLIINVAVGGTNGWFEDGKSGKPWVDTSPTARLDFWNARDQWQPTWQNDGQMIIKSVKMWQQKGYNGCDKGAKKVLR